MQELVDWQRAEFGNKKLHPVEIAARFHHEFTAIHPFDDGNGRMARLLMNLLLMQHGYPPVVIRLQERDDYLMALRQADLGNKEAFLTFIAGKVADSLDLFLRAASGEEIHEPTDLEKEIALLKLGLQHIEEPQVLTQELQKQLFEASLDPLFLEIKRHLLPLCDLFEESLVFITGDHGNAHVVEGINKKFEILTAKSFPKPAWEIDKVIFNLKVVFELNTFKKGKFDTFDSSLTLNFDFASLKYSIDSKAQKSPLPIQRFYQEQLTKDEITAIAQQVARFFLDAIREKTTS